MSITPTGAKALPIVEALDGQGFPRTREARYISDLPHEERKQALAACGPTLSQAIGAPIVAPVRFGTPVHLAFGLTRPQAKNHPQRDLLLTPGCDLSLSYCPLYETAGGAA